MNKSEEMEEKMKKRLPFTALELVLVITIAAILLSISIPAFYSISQGRRLTGAMTAIAANVSLARARAVSGMYTLFPVDSIPRLRNKLIKYKPVTLRQIKTLEFCHSR